VGVVRVLCELGANKEARDYSGMTPLMSACRSKISDGTVSVLCELGANKEARDPQGKTALFYALNIPNLEYTASVLRELLEHDVDIEARFGSKSALDAAVETRIPEVVRILCEHARRKNIELNTPMAAHRVKKEIGKFKELLQNVPKKDNNNLSWGNGNSNYGGEYVNSGMSLYTRIVNDLEDILKILEKEPRRPNGNGSKRTTKKSLGSESGGAGKGSNSNWWRSPKSKTRRFKNRV
jgi:ankyrin repeat protein